MLHGAKRLMCLDPPGGRADTSNLAGHTAENEEGPCGSPLREDKIFETWLVAEPWRIFMHCLGDVCCTIFTRLYAKAKEMHCT